MICVFLAVGSAYQAYLDDDTTLSIATELNGCLHVVMRYCFDERLTIIDD